jgi:hypothetical protein
MIHRRPIRLERAHRRIADAIERRRLDRLREGRELRPTAEQDANRRYITLLTERREDETCLPE